MAISKNIWLSIDLSTRMGSIALHRFDGSPTLIESKHFTDGTRHSELLLTYVAEILEKQALKMENLERIICSLGPGSFTGLRIALSSAKAIARVLEMPLDLVNSSEARLRQAVKQFNLQGQSVHAFTRVASNSYVEATLTNEGKFVEDQTVDLKTERVESSSVALIDSAESPKFGFSKTHLFPSFAEFLADSLLVCQSRKTYSTVAELVAAAPEYFGSSRFGA